MIKDIKPISHELMYVYIAADGKKFFSSEKAKKYQRYLIARNSK